MGSKPFLKQLLKKMSAKLGAMTQRKPYWSMRPGRVFAAGAAAEVLAGQQDAGALVARLVQHEVRIGLAAVWVLAGLTRVQVAPCVKQVGAKAGLADRLEELLWDDGVGVDVGAVHRGHQAFEEGEFLHVGCPRALQANFRMSTKWPCTAAAAAMAGLTRVGAAARALTAFEVAVAGGGATLAGL